MPEFPPFYDNVAACHTEFWRCLKEGVNDRHSPFHTPALATVDSHGRPQVRAVALRAVDQSSGTLRFHCDRRSEKASEIHAARAAALQAFDPESRIQIRIDGTAELHTNGWIAQSAWTEAHAMEQVGYGIAPAPGTALASGGDYTLPHEDDAILSGRDNFAVAVVRAERLEFLYLDRRGHRRALWLRSDVGWVETWLVP